MTTFNARAVWPDIRAALEAYEAAQNGFQAGEMPAEERLALSIVGAIIPQLKGMLTVINAVSGEWLAPRNRIDGKIAEAFSSGQPLAGYDPKDWLVWGNMLKKLNLFLDTENTIEYPDETDETITPRQTIDTVFTKAEV